MTGEEIVWVGDALFDLGTVICLFQFPIIDCTDTVKVDPPLLKLYEYGFYHLSSIDSFSNSVLTIAKLGFQTAGT